MRPPLWHPPVELSTGEHARLKRIRRATLLVCRRQHRPALFADALPQERLPRSTDQPPGQPPVPPAHLALATLLHASPQVSDDAGIAATTMERRWPVGLEGLAAEPPPCSNGPLVAVPQRLSAPPRDRRWLARTVARAATSGAFGPRQVRAAVERSPRWGAGRGEEPDNLLGHALRKALSVSARQQGRRRRAVAAEAGASAVAGPSRHAALDVDWEDPKAPQHVLPMILEPLRASPFNMCRYLVLNCHLV